MFGSELPALVDQKRYEDMTIDDLKKEIIDLELQLTDPNLTDSNRLALQEQLMYATRVRDGVKQQGTWKNIQEMAVPAMVGGAAYYFVMRNPNVQDKRIAPIVGLLTAWGLNRVLVR